MKRLTLAAIFTLFCLPAQAQIVIGTISSGDTIWYLTYADGHSKSGWSGDDETAIITLFGHTSKDTIKASQGALSIRFYLFQPKEAQFISEVDVVYYEDETKGAYVTKGHGDGSIIGLEQVGLVGDQMILSGTFMVPLLFTDDFGVTLRQNDTRWMQGRFNAVLIHE